MMKVLRLPFRSNDSSRQFQFGCLRKKALLLLCLGLGSTVFAQLKDPASHPKFVNPLPDPSVIDATAGGDYSMEMAPATQWLGLVDVNDDPLYTNVWGYGLTGVGVTFPGPTFWAKEGNPVDVTWINNLPDNHLLPIDLSIHVAHPHTWFGHGIPTVAHLHGGHTESESDGIPDAWFTRNNTYKGHDYVKAKYHYDNDQESATLWYHDHALGITRLNVYAGLAGFYLLRDDNELSLGLPSGDYEREIVFQDRDFDENGQLIMPADGGSQGDCQVGAEGGPFVNEEPIIPEAEQTPGTPSVMAEFFGNYIIVNGMTWPYMSVEPRQYRLRLLNGSDSRFYFLELQRGASGDSIVVPILQIGTDDGLLYNPVAVNHLLLAPGERADIIVDFTGLSVGPGTVLTWFNYGADDPFGGDPEGPAAEDLDDDLTRPTAQIMQFRVDLPFNGGVPNTSFNTGSQMRENPITILSSGISRKLVLFEGRDAYCRLRPQLGILDENSYINGSLMWDELITENPDLNAIEYWDIYNTTADAHPIHLHQVTFQILDRTTFDGQVEFIPTGDPISGGSKQVLTLNSPVTFAPGWDAPDREKGWKDTGVIPPGGVMRVAAKFDLPGKYVWHCHILSHEDHEMMRPFWVGPMMSGRIIWEHDDASGVNEATVNITGAATHSSRSNKDGIYFLPIGPAAGVSTIKPVKNINKFNGVTAADASSIQKHVANIFPITDPYKMVCADVNKSNSVTTLDASLVVQALLGNPIANSIFNTSWRFVPTDHAMSNPPWGFPEQRTYTDISTSYSDQDFFGMKIGDVTATYSNPANFGGVASMVLNAGDQWLEAGQPLSVEFKADQMDDLTAFQFALAFDPLQLKFESVEPLQGLPLAPTNFGTFNADAGELRVVWAEAASYQVEEAAPVFRLHFTAMQSGAKLSDVLNMDESVLMNRAYNSNLEETAVELRFTEVTGIDNPEANFGVQMLVRPNPFRDETTVSFTLPEACEAQLRVLDASGRELLRSNNSYPAGNNSETLRLDGSFVTGLLYCELVTPFGVVTQKMVAAR